MNTMWFNIGMSVILGFLTEIRNDPMGNMARKMQIRKAMLKLYNVIKAVYGDDPEFSI